MKTLRRFANIQVFDSGTLELQPELSREGFLSCMVNATRTGIFIYQDENGNEVRALRDDSEVFAPASTATLPGKPITRTHPSTLLDAGSARGALVGATGDKVSRVEGSEFNLLRTSAHVFDGPTITAIQVDGKKEVSCGYLSDVVDEPGIHPKYGAYDVKQTNIRYNHLAVAIDAGRGGPQVRMLLDSSALSFKQEPTMTPEEQKILDAAKKAGITGEGMVDVDLGGEKHSMTPKLADAIKGHLDRMKKEHSGAHDDLAKQIKGLKAEKEEDDDDVEGLAEASEGEGAEDSKKGKMDSIVLKGKNPRIAKLKDAVQKLAGKLAGTRAELKAKMDAVSPDKLAAAAKDQARLVAVVCALDSKAKANDLFGKPAGELKKLAILAREPKALLDGKDAPYIDGRFDAVASGVQLNLGKVLGEAMMDNAEAALVEQQKITEANAPKKWTPPALTATKGGDKK